MAGNEDARSGFQWVMSTLATLEIRAPCPKLGAIMVGKWNRLQEMPKRRMQRDVRVGEVAKRRWGWEEAKQRRPPALTSSRIKEEDKDASRLAGCTCRTTYTPRTSFHEICIEPAKIMKEKITHHN